MSSGSSPGRSANRITAGIEPGTFPASIVDFVEFQLPSWRDDADRTEEQSENELNAQLSKFLDIQARTHFPMVFFQHEERQTNQRRVDLSVLPVVRIVIEAVPYTIYQPVLVLECKRLPAPTSDREMEYVTGFAGRSGGIQRFKLGLHGARLQVAGIIGYVQDQAPGHWHNQINRWVSSLANGQVSDGSTWELSEVLGVLSEDHMRGVARCQSEHGRQGDVASPRIQLHHVWVVMNRRLATWRS
jgi:hypothetical protein